MLLVFPNIKLQDNKGLYAELDNKNVSDIDLSSANLIVGKNITGESSNGSGVLTFDLSASGISSAFYENFDEERYSVSLQWWNYWKINIWSNLF